MKKLLFLIALVFMIAPLWGQDDGLSPDDFFDAEETEEAPQNSGSKPKKEEKVEESGDEFFPDDMEVAEEKSTDSKDSGEEVVGGEEEVVGGEEEIITGDEDFGSDNEMVPPPGDDGGFEEEENQNIGGLGLDENRGTRSITVSGGLALRYAYREQNLTEALSGVNTEDADFFDPLIMLRLDIQLANGIKAVLQMQHENREGNTLFTDFGTTRSVRRANNDIFDLEFERAYIEVGGFLANSINLKVGVIPHKYALRANGDAFFLDLGESEGAFTSDDFVNDDVNATGVLLTWQPVKALEMYVDAFHFKVRDGDLDDDTDEAITGINIDFYAPKTIQTEDGATHTLSRFFNLAFAAIEVQENLVFSLNAGVDYFMSPRPDIYLLELYGEAIFQFGSTIQDDVNGNEQNQNHLAFGGYFGFRYTYTKSPFQPFIDVSAWYISGDDDDANQNKNRDLITFEDIDSTLIVEENDFGLDIDSNYWAVKIQSGVSLAPVLEEQVRLELLYAHFEAIDVNNGGSKHMGEEIDLRLIWEYSSDLTFALVAGVLFNSSLVKDLSPIEGGESTFIFRLETNLRF